MDGRAALDPAKDVVEGADEAELGHDRLGGHGVVCAAGGGGRGRCRGGGGSRAGDRGRAVAERRRGARLGRAERGRVCFRLLGVVRAGRQVRDRRRLCGRLRARAGVRGRQDVLAPQITDCERAGRPPGGRASIPGGDDVPVSRGEPVARVSRLCTARPTMLAASQLTAPRNGHGSIGASRGSGLSGDEALEVTGAVVRASLGGDRSGLDAGGNGSRRSQRASSATTRCVAGLEDVSMATSAAGG